METEFDLDREIELYQEYADKEANDAFIDELAMRYCGDVYIVSAK